jgi:hypothetical protein
MDIINTLFDGTVAVAIGIILGLIIAGIIGVIVLGIVTARKRLKRKT